MEALGCAKFNMAKTVLLPFGHQEYRSKVLKERRINDLSRVGNIPLDIRIVPDGQTCRILGAWIGNNVSDNTPWPGVMEAIAQDLTHWNLSNPSPEGRRHIINMTIGGRTQYLSRVQGMPVDVEHSLITMEHNFLWEGKRARIAHETMILPVNHGGKQILDIPSRLEAIDLWLLKNYLYQGPDRATWCYLLDYILADFLEMSYLHIPFDQIFNIFLQDIHVPISRKTPLPLDVRRLIQTARKHKVKFTGLSISMEIRLQMPIWRHISVDKKLYMKACGFLAAHCLRNKHNVVTVHDLMIIAHRSTIVARKPHQQNPSGIGRKNCACPPCHKDRTQLGCENPGKCILVAQMLLNSTHPKWKPTMNNHDLCSELALTEDEQHMNQKTLQDDEAVAFDPVICITPR